MSLTDLKIFNQKKVLFQYPFVSTDRICFIFAYKDFRLLIASTVLILDISWLSITKSH